ncbi:hypothetical protein RF55_15770 [Lasius niger]|uniref:Uncharacterized protein n=1 Tax=Lasius niger TaxID=67767 RepID=A0A0J7K574_LASNI|nr:hypothetical protein RF55_15770 [Lasius niger]
MLAQKEGPLGLKAKGNEPSPIACAVIIAFHIVIIPGRGLEAKLEGKRRVGSAENIVNEIHRQIVKGSLGRV